MPNITDPIKPSKSEEIKFIFNRKAIIETIIDLRVGGIENPEEEYFQIQLQNFYMKLKEEIQEIKKELKDVNS